MGQYETKKSFAQRPPTEWEKIFANYILDKGLKSKYTKNSYTTQHQKINNLIKKWAEDLNRYLFQRRHTDGQQTHEKMLNITNHPGNASQNRNEILPHTCQKSYYQKDNK